MMHRTRPQRTPARAPTPAPPDGVPASEEAEDATSLARRLRGLKWPEAPSGLRERCWREFQELVERRGSGEGNEVPEHPADERPPAA